MARERENLFQGLKRDQKAFLCALLVSVVAATTLAFGTGDDGPRVLAVLTCVTPVLFFGSLSVFHWANEVVRRLDKLQEKKRQS